MQLLLTLLAAGSKSKELSQSNSQGYQEALVLMGKAGQSSWLPPFSVNNLCLGLNAIDLMLWSLHPSGGRKAAAERSGSASLVSWSPAPSPTWTWTLPPCLRSRRRSLELACCDEDGMTLLIECFLWCIDWVYMFLLWSDELRVDLGSFRCLVF